MSQRLWVTGLGLVTPLGAGVEATWRRLVRGDRAIRSIRLFDTTGQRVSIAGEVGEVALPSGPEHVAGAWSRTSAMALAAAEEAMRGAGITAREGRVGLVVGGTTGGMFETEELLARLHGDPGRDDVLASMLSHPLTATGDRIHERLGPFSRVRSLSSACSSGANAIVVAATWLLADEVDVVIAGGSDGLCRLTLSGFNALTAIDSEPCRPFDRRRSGTSLGEGAGFLVLERAKHARGRGATPIAELAGWALGSEAHHITNPAPDGAVVASLVEHAIARAGLSRLDIDYVNAHGTGTPLNDPMEASALSRALGDEISRVPVSSSKGQIGHTLGAAGAIEAAITALVVSRHTLVPTGGLDEPDPALKLVHVAHVGREVPRVRAALSNAFGFGGMDTVLVFTEPELGPGLPGGSQPVVVTGVAAFGVCGLVGTAGCATLTEDRFAPNTLVDPDSRLDPARARRLDRTARLGVVAVERALVDAGLPPLGMEPSHPTQTGIVLGSAFGNVDSSAAFMHRILKKGPRSASPAEFPNLVPSSPVGHASIYLGHKGPTFATADLATSGESAVVQASQLVAAGEVSRIVAGALESKGGIVEQVLSVLFAHAASQAGARRTDLAAAIVLETEQEAKERGAHVLAQVRQVLEWRGDANAAVVALVAPGEGGEVILARGNGGAGRVLDMTPWARCPRFECAPALGENDALGAVAVAIGAARIATMRTRDALVLGLAQGRGYAIVLSAP